MEVAPWRQRRAQRFEQFCISYLHSSCLLAYCYPIPKYTAQLVKLENFKNLTKLIYDDIDTIRLWHISL